MFFVNVFALSYFQVKKVERRLASEEKRSLKNPDGLSEPIEE
jgi:hypothetical protein